MSSARWGALSQTMNGLAIGVLMAFYGVGLVNSQVYELVFLPVPNKRN